jgi:5-methylcytosine-specific restriction endonuclease McrA
MSSTRRRRQRDRVVARDGVACVFCGEPIDLSVSPDTTEGWSLEHVHPRGDGGPNSIDNLKLAHRRCNQEAGKRAQRAFARPRIVLNVGDVSGGGS